MTENVHPEIPHFFEIMKIVEASVNGNRSKVIAYAEQLAVKLEQDGNQRAAERVRRVLSQSKLMTLSAANAVAPTKLPVDSESRMSLGEERLYTPQDVSVSLSSRAKEVLTEFVRFVKASDALTANGVGISPTLLLHGPPGCGKTEIAKSVSAELELPLITARMDSLVSSYLGSTAKNIRLLFEHAQSKPCILFLDELDAIAKLRDDRHELGELKRVVISLLQNIDALHNQTVLLAATNHQHLLDPAIWRRFAFRLAVELPTLDQRFELFRIFIGDFATESELHTAATLTEGLTGADIRQIAEDSKRTAVIDQRSTTDLTELVRRIMPKHNPQIFGSSLPLSLQLTWLREYNKSIFSYRFLAALFGISLGYVHKLLKRESDNG